MIMKFSIMIFDIFTVVQTRIASLSLVLNCNVMNHTDMVSACITMDCISVTQILGGIICMLVCFV